VIYALSLRRAGSVVARACGYSATAIRFFTAGQMGSLEASQCRALIVLLASRLAARLYQFAQGNGTKIVLIQQVQNGRKRADHGWMVVMQQNDISRLRGCDCQFL
jgi:L-2-hydroxyglutarate oxidase LhgO